MLMVFPVNQQNAGLCDADTCFKSSSCNDEYCEDQVQHHVIQQQLALQIMTNNSFS